MSQYSGYKFKFNSILIQSTSPGSSEHMWIQLLRKSRMIRSYFSAYLFSILSTFPVDITDKTVEHLKRYIKIYHSETNGDYPLFYTVIKGNLSAMSTGNVERILNKYAEK